MDCCIHNFLYLKINAFLYIDIFIYEMSHLRTMLYAIFYLILSDENQTIKYLLLIRDSIFLIYAYFKEKT